MSLKDYIRRKRKLKIEFIMIVVRTSYNAYTWQAFSVFRKRGRSQTMWTAWGEGGVKNFEKWSTLY